MSIQSYLQKFHLSDCPILRFPHHLHLNNPGKPLLKLQAGGLVRIVNDFPLITCDTNKPTFILKKKKKKKILLQIHKL